MVNKMDTSSPPKSQDTLKPADLKSHDPPKIGGSKPHDPPKTADPKPHDPPKTGGSKRHKKPSSTSSKNASSTSNKTQFYCSTCAVHCPNSTTLAQHNTGKKHLSNVHNTQRRDKHAMCSIFVGNLPKLAKVKATLEQDSAAAPAQEPVPGKENEKLKCDLQSLFGRFGDISKIIVDKNHGSYCIIEYASPTMAQTVLAQYQQGNIPKFYDRKLQIKSRKVTEIKPLTNLTLCNEIQLDNITALLQEAEDEPEFGLGMVDNAICVSDTASVQRKGAVKRLQEQLNQHFPFHNIQLTLYGSSATALALLDSDLDLSLRVGAGKRLERDDLITVLKQKCVGISHVHVIPAPGGKITRFLEGISSTMCDVLFTNRLGIANTRLLATILTYDTRLSRLVRVLVYWNRVVLGARFAKQCIPSSYAVTIMVLYYLRQAGIIPDFFDSMLSDAQMVYDIDCGHVTDISKLPVSGNTDSICALMRGYFQFYGSVFNREDHVVSIRSNTPVEKTALYSEADSMESETGVTSQIGSTNTASTYVTVFKPSALAVQDPFVLTHNIAHNVTLECAVLFGDLCRNAVVQFTQNTPLHAWLFSVGTKSQVSDVGSHAVSDEGSDEDEEGNKTPVWNADSTPISTGSKRSVEDMEH